MNLLKKIVQDKARLHTCAGCGRKTRTLWVVTFAFGGELCFGCLGKLAASAEQQLEKRQV